MPSLTSVNPKIASSAAMAMSQTAARPAPPPSARAVDLTDHRLRTVIDLCETCRSCVRHRRRWRRSSARAIRASSRYRRPHRRLCPPGQHDRTHVVGRRDPRKTSCSCSIVSALKAFRASGRARVTWAMPSETTRRMLSAMGAGVRGVIRAASRALYFKNEGCRAPGHLSLSAADASQPLAWVLAFVVLIGSGLQIFNASPNLEPPTRVTRHGVCWRSARRPTALERPRSSVIRSSPRLARLDRRRHG